MFRPCSLLPCYIFFILTIILLPESLPAQKAVYSTRSKQAIKRYQEATSFYDVKNNAEARRLLLSALEKDSNFIEAHMLLASVYADAGDYESGIECYKKAIAINPNFFPNNYYSIGKFEFLIGRYADAKGHFEKFLTYKNTYPELKEKAERDLRNCIFSLEYIQHPVEFDPVNLGRGVNSADDEYYPSLTVDNQTLVYTRNIGSGELSSMAQEDFFISHNEGGVWGMAFNAGAPLNSSLNEGAPSISADGKLLFFAACDRGNGLGSCDIYMTRIVNERWSQPTNLGAPVNSSDWETQPSFTSDGKELYYIKGYNTREGKHVSDIYVSKLGNDGRFQTPVRLSNVINTDGEEESVFIHPDCKTMYFSSNGHPGFGGLDIYISRRDENGEWQKPVNLGYPINSYNDENSLLVSPDGITAYYASDRKGGNGRLDLYSFKLAEQLRPQRITYVKGTVKDGDNKKPLGARYEIYDVGTGKLIKWANADKNSGEFIACLNSGRDYMLNVSHPNYLFYSDHFSCKSSVDFSSPYMLEIELEPIRAGESVVLKNIFFDSDKFDLREESFAELEKLSSFLSQNPTVKIEIGGHTDNTGDPKKNQLLSESRAKAVNDYLITKSIAADRITFKGYGDTKPVGANDTAEGRAKNRRTEFTIVQ